MSTGLFAALLAASILIIISVFVVHSRTKRHEKALTKTADDLGVSTVEAEMLVEHIQDEEATAIYQSHRQE